MSTQTSLTPVETTAFIEWLLTVGAGAAAAIAIDELAERLCRRARQLWTVLSYRRRPHVVSGDAGRVGWSTDAYGAVGSVGRATPPA